MMAKRMGMRFRRIRPYPKSMGGFRAVFTDKSTGDEQAIKLSSFRRKK
jgi:hypothetical protein